MDSPPGVACRHPVAAYCHVPAPLRQIMKLPGLKHFLVVARPTIEPSGGLLHYRLAVPKDVRRRAPLLAVVDEPGLAADELAGEGGKYHWCVASAAALSWYTFLLLLLLLLLLPRIQLLKLVRCLPSPAAPAGSRSPSRRSTAWTWATSEATRSTWTK